jgi:hypothetical protein
VCTPITQIVLLCMQIYTYRRTRHADGNFWDRRFNRVKVKVTEQFAIYLLVCGTPPGGATAYGISVR